MASKKQSRWNESLINTKTNKPAQMKASKDPSAGGKQAASSVSKPSVSSGRSSSLNSRGEDSTAAAGKVGGCLKRGSIVSQHGAGHPANRQPSGQARPALRLSSSRSFSSLHTSSLTAAPFMRSSRSLNRLDQRSTEDSEVKKGNNAGKKILDSARLSASEEQIIRYKKDGDNAEKRKTSLSPQPPDSSSSLVPTNSSHYNKGNKQNRDGVYTLCAMTSGIKRNWVQAVLKNVRPSVTHDSTSSQSVQTTEQLEDSHLQDHQTNLQPEGAESPSDGSSSLLPVSGPSPTNLPQQVEAGEAAAHQCSLLEGAPQTAASPGSQSESSASTAVPSNNVCLDEHSNMQSGTEQAEPTKQAVLNIICDCIKEPETPPREQQTVQLVKELEQTQRELSRLQQLNKSLNQELQLERESHSLWTQTDTKSPSEQNLTLQRLQQINRDLRFELDAQKRSQEEAREAELRRRVDLLAQQAQLLVTGDATAIAQAQLEQDRRRFQDQRMEWEHCVASLKSKLAISEEQRKETESRLAQLQQELQSLQNLQQEAEGLRKHLQELTAQIRANEEAQAQKEVRLQKHLALLQASQERERRSLAASLAQAEQHSQDLQERLDRAEQQVESLNKTQTWTREIEEAQRELQEELARTVSAVQQLQEERNQLDQRCQELQSQLSEADKEVSRLQGRLKTDETHYYNLEHSYERVCEELQVALGKVQQREAETQDIREGYERMLDSKEQELSEVLLKMEVLGNSLEETEVKLNEVLKERQTSEPKETDAVIQEHARTRSRSIDSLYQFAPGDDPERFISVIQFLETKLYVTEEKLRDITQRLEEHQSHISCQDPHLCSQLTESRATAQHLSLLLHSHAKQSQRFAQETESRCRMLVGRFQVALNIVQACRERLHATPIDIPDFERQLATVAACLQQGEKDAERQKNESYNASKVEGKVLKLTNTQPSTGDTGTPLKRELFVVEKMMSVLQSQDAFSRLSSVRRDGGADVTHRYKNLISQRASLKTDDCDESLESLICRVCAEAELIHSALKLQTQEVQLQRADLADISPPELAPYEEEEEEVVQADGTGSEGAGPDVKKVEAEKEPEWLQRLLSRLQRRATFLHQLCQESSEDTEEGCRNHGEDPALDLNYLQEQTKLVYLSDRLYLDLEKEFQQNKAAALSKEPDEDEQEALCQLQEDNSTLREELERTEQKIVSVESVNQRLLEDIEKIEDYHDEQTQKLEAEFQEKIRKLQQIHEEEMKHLHGFYSKDKQTKQTFTQAPHVSDMYSLSDQTVMERRTKEDFRTRTAGGDAATMREAYQKDLEKLKACCDEEFTAMEEKHRKLIEDLQQQHQKEVSELLKEKNQLLQEETAATMAAIVAMRRAHKQELEKSKQSQSIRQSADITQLHTEYEKEIQLLHKELEVLSVQHTEKCLENTQLLQELQDERKSTTQCHKENQELKKKQREAEETAHLHFSVNGNQSQAAAHVNDFYEMEVILRAREAEMQFLRQEACSLREDLKIARMDKIYAQNKLKTLYEPHQHVSKPDEDLKFSTWSSSRDASGQKLKDTNSAAFLKKAEKSSLMRQIRGVRSKSLKEGLSVQERMKLFESF